MDATTRLAAVRTALAGIRSAQDLSDVVYLPEPGVDVFGYELIDGVRVVDLVPFAATALGATPGVLIGLNEGITPKAVIVGLVGSAVGLGAGAVAWLFLPPHRPLF